MKKYLTRKGTIKIQGIKDAWLMNKIPAIIIMLLIVKSSFATIGTDKALFVDNFGTSIFMVDENNDSIYEREDSLLSYAKREGYTTLILRKLSVIKVNSTVFLLPDSLINTVSPDTLKENHLARFIHRARTNFGVLHVASGALPYYRTKKTFYYQNPNHFVNINFFNLRVKALFGISYCFDMIMAEQDYWLSNNPITAPNLDSNWTVFYLAGIRYMYQTVRNTSNSSGYNPLLITTYIGDLTVLTDTPFAAKNYIAEQSQVDSIDKYTDIDYIDFYLNGDKMDKYNSIDGSLQIFRYDKRKGYRMFRFANNTKPSYIVPLFNAQAAVDILNVSYLGDNLINQNGICFNPSDSTWRRTVDGVTSYFDSLFTNKINPYNLHSSSFIDTTKTLEQLTVTSVSSPNAASNMSKGVAWFKYSTVPNSGYVVHMPSDSLNLSVVLLTRAPE